MEEHVLFGKYRVCRQLGRGRSGIVYLAYHTELEEYRAVKIVSKSMSDYATFRKEALFLKTLRHPGIPLVYDVEEDEENSYLIEEYLEGESLYALVKRLGSLSADTAVHIGIQICRIIQFMNSVENPILYLDLQPKNLVVCKEQVRLTDFDHAQYAADAAAFGERYGTVGFAAPEQYRGEPLDCRTDIYAIGALLYFMCRGKPPGREPDSGAAKGLQAIERIFFGCMAEKKEERYQTAAELETALLELQNHLSEEQAIRSQIIVFAGARPGIGTTHAALGMSNFLARNGYPTLYQEEYDTDAVRALARSMGLHADSTGVFQIGALKLRPYYGRSVQMPYRYFPTIVKDTGAFWQQGNILPKADYYVLLCGGKWWETENSLKAARFFRTRGRVILLFNHTPENFLLKLPEDLRGLSCLRLPFFPNPLKKDGQADACFEKLIQMGRGGERTWRKPPGRRLWRRKSV
ncbi:MAG: serine/threonine protein kinase [Lachnospiraceae bacterium]|nr:serine/threonine protein kinase [Lachnospiraceae bacterium]